jgi:hypothetical protein
VFGVCVCTNVCLCECTCTCKLMSECACVCACACVLVQTHVCGSVPFVHTAPPPWPRLQEIHWSTRVSIDLYAFKMLGAPGSVPAKTF